VTEPTGAGSSLRGATLEQLLLTLRRWWWLPVVLGLLAGGAAGASAAAEPPTYEARSQLLVGSIAGDTGMLRASGQLVQTYAQLIDSDLVWEEILASWDRPESFSATALGTSETRILQITATATDPDTAAAGANEVGRALRTVLLRTPMGPEGEIRELSAAVPPARPVSPNVRLSTLLGALAGAALGTALLLVIARRKDLVTSASALSAVVPVVARLRDPDRLDEETGRLIGAKLARALDARGVRGLAVVAVPARVPVTSAGLVADALHRVGRTTVTVEHVRDDGLGPRPPRGPVGDEPEVGFDDRPRRAAGAVAVERQVTELLSTHDTVLAWTSDRVPAVGLLTATAAGAAVLEVRRHASRLQDVRLVVEELESLGVTVVGALLVDHVPRRSARVGRPPSPQLRPITAARLVPTLPLDSVRDRDGVA
jgi:capsular polysaccharide biosynthesis protein